MKKLLLLAALPILFACQREDAKPAAAAPVASSVAQVATAKSSDAVKPVAVATPVIVAKPVKADKPAQTTLAPAPVAPTVVPVAVSVPGAAAVVPPEVEVKVPAVVSAADSMALAKKRNCFACHMIDKKGVGPSWKDVAAKYRGDAGAQARMEAKIGKGGSGAWGNMAMPPQPQVAAEERAILARFILNLQ